MGKQVKWGVLGTADIAKKCTIPAMQKAKNCTLYGIAGRNPEKTDRFKGMFQFEKAFYSYESMLEDEEVEAVYIALPNSMHKEWVLKAAEKGKHILCEKPIAGNAADVEEMVKACRDAGVILMEAFAYLHSPASKIVKDALDSGIIGTPTLIETTFVTPSPEADDIRMRKETLGGAMYDLGCYNTSLILMLVGEEPSEVRAVAHLTEAGIDDTTVAYLEFPGGTRASILTGMCSGRRADRYYIYGTDGTMEVPIPFNADGVLKFYVHRAKKSDTISVAVPDNYMLEIEQLGRCILHDEEPCVSNEFSIKNARIIDRILACIGY
ncbi:Gfo/Idh/MocA family protein [Anaerobium acetethylicum]|uniref:Predicted dehydrogenase n=1 Tax=Anaerobium acetethylicum TaxID=1619234 RepID=A0A1D3TP80_9FIRM|nr:Gfo/Idh/MocA family oxidoreductase [Anaerobium acetethylicum]SCP95186.1 Predicted dehydrogenase [Anaerobium acetethylicum]